MSSDTSANPQNYKVSSFEGPIDLLLYLVRKNEVNIYDIPIAEITEQFMEAIKLSTSINLDNVTDFYLMASTLIYIKSRMLLPVEVNFEDDIEDPRKELVERLIQHQKIKKLSKLMEEKEQETEWVVERKKDQRMLPFDDDDNLWHEVEVWELVKSFSSIMKNINSEKIVNLFEEVSVNEKITLMNELIENQGNIMFTDLLINPDSILEIVCSFLALLEQVKLKAVRVFQNRLFGDIRISRRDEEEKKEEIEGSIDE